MAALVTWICAVCCVIQVAQWIICWALKKPYTGRRGKNDYVQSRDKTVIARLARLERLIDNMTALKNENSKRNYCFIKYPLNIE